MRKLGRITAAGLILVFLLTSTALYAGWIDDWYSEATYSGPTSFKGQKRGYATAGNLSLRWNPHTDYPISISLPRIDAGCGGIDVFMGGMSFANMPDYLVQKLQALVSAAPAIAFEVALSVLNEQLSNKMDAIEKATDFLNNIQLNDCKASQVMVQDISHALGKAMSSKTIKTGIENGASDMWQSMKKDVQGSSITQALVQAGAGDGSLLTATCPAEVKSLVQANSVVQYLLNKQGYGNEIVEFVRGLVGDVRMTAGGTVATYVAPCPDNKPGTGLETLVTENGYRKLLSNDSCQKVTSITMGGVTYSSIYDWTGQMLAQLADHLKNRTPITAGSNLEKFISMVPAPVYMAVQNAVLEQSDNDLGASLTDVVSKAVMWKIMSDLYSVMQYNIAKADEILTKQQGGADSEHCKLPGVPALSQNLKMVNKTLKAYQQAAQTDYVNSLETLMEIEQKNQRVMEARKTLHSLLANAFSGSMADRVMKSK